MKNSQIRGIEKDKLMQHGKKIGPDEIVRQNERINNNLKFQV